MIRVAAVGDIHVGEDVRGLYRKRLTGIADDADVLLVAGDLTQHGTAEEGRMAAEELRDLGVPVITVLGNHDYHSDAETEISQALTDAGITVLEGESAVIDCHGRRLGIAGAKGFGGGFAGRCGSDFGEPEMKAFIRYTKATAARLGEALNALDTDARVALTHYAPVKDTLEGEPLEIYPFLGSYLLAEVIDGARADLAVHGHAHRGVEKGITPGGIPVRNAALPVIERAYSVYCLGGADDVECAADDTVGATA
ncbi:MAG: metallophosphoesterase [Actinoallomurus sp.]